MTPTISVIIVSYNSWPYVGNCIASLYDNAPSLPFEILLIDNASSDGTTDYVRSQFPLVVVISSATNDGYGSAVNRAVRDANGEYFVFLNPDCEVRPGAIDALVAFADTSEHIGVVGPRLIVASGAPQPSGRRFPSSSQALLEVFRLHRLFSAGWRADHLLGTYWDQSETRRVDWVSGACHVLTRRVWHDVGPLTEKTFCGFDDLEYCYRAAERGLETWLCAGATVMHHVGTSVSQRWHPAEVDELAINNAYVLLEDLWPAWRVRLLALCQAAGAASDCIAAALQSRNVQHEEPRQRVRRSARQVVLLLSLASGRRSPIYRCDPGSSSVSTRP